MSKNQQKNTFNDASGLLNSFEGTNAGDVSALQGETSAATGTASAALGSAQGAYGALNPAGVSSILAPGTAASGGIASTGGYAAPQLSSLEGQENTNLQGLDPTALSGLSSQYQDLISSGGISDATAAAMQRQAVAGVGSVYGTLNNQLNRTKETTGGQGGGGETAEMARQLSSSEANAVTGVNAQVGQLRQQGTEAGLSGASNLTAAQAQAQNSAANTFSGTQSGVASGMQTGANLLNSVGSTAVNADLSSAGGLANIAGLTAQQQQALQSDTLGTQTLGVSGEQGFLSSMGNTANAQQGPFGDFLSYLKAVSGPAAALATGG
jgi:hypothetical protein